MSQITAIVAGALFVCKVATATAQVQSEVQQRREWRTDKLVFANQFSGARLNDLRRIGEKRYLAISRPEFSPINPSPWYSFEIESEAPSDIEISFLVDSTHPDTVPLLPSRPWLSSDGGEIYQQVSENAWNRGDFIGAARIQLPVGRLRVSAWKPYSLETSMRWCDDIEVSSFASGFSIGLSMEGRPIRQSTISETDAPRFIVLLGGRHPPEATGNLGHTHFVAQICGDDGLFRRFRREFQTIVIPMINPDVKYHGNRRCTLGGKDPNYCREFIYSQDEQNILAKTRDEACALMRVLLSRIEEVAR